MRRFTGKTRNSMCVEVGCSDRDLEGIGMLRKGEKRVLAIRVDRMRIEADL